MHIVTSTRSEGKTVCDQRMANHRVAALKSIDPFADIFYPTGIFMPHDIGQFHIDFLAPDPFDDVKIGATNTGSADAHNDVGIVLDFWFWHFLQSYILRIGKTSIILVKNSSFHSVKVTT